MCHNTMIQLDNLNAFLYLSELCIVNQPISVIEHLDKVLILLNIILS